MDALIRDIQRPQPVVHALQKTAGAAQVKVVVIQRQPRLDLGEIEATGYFKITPQNRLSAWVTECTMDMQVLAIALLQRLEFGLEWQVRQGSGALKQIHRALPRRLTILRSQLAKHREQGRDAHPGSDQHHRALGFFDQGKAARSEEHT